jgi:anti-sigma B factor antagonist
VSVAEPDGGAPVVVLSGELDMATSEAAAACLAALVETAGDIVVDLSGLQFIDSTGLSALLTACRESEDRGRTLTLRRPARTVRRVLTMTGLDRVFRIEP